MRTLFQSKCPSLIISVLLTLLCGCSKINYNETSPVTILGLDGATWEVIDAMIARGELPGFQKLKRIGSYGELTTFRPTESVSIWTSIATGVDPKRHMVQTFMRRIPGTDKLVSTPSTDRRVPALWNIASQHNRKVLCVKWFASWPAEQINGLMLSSRLEDDCEGYQTYPPELYAEISSYRERSTLSAFPKASKRQTIAIDDDMPLKPGLLQGKNISKTRMFDDTSVWAVGYDLYKKHAPDLFMIYFKSLDRVQHFLWGSHADSQKEDATKETVADAEVMFAWYRYFDSIIERLLQDPDRILIVISDHGFQSRESVSVAHDMYEFNLDLLLNELGFLTRSSAEATEWSTTRAYTLRAYPFDHKYDVNINRQGREPAGIVTSDACDAVVDDITRTLSELKSVDDIPMFTSVAQSDVSDLRCVLNPAISIESHIKINDSIVPVLHWIQSKQWPRGVHIDAPAGILAIAGPGIRQGFNIAKATVFDITPTVLYCLGLPVAKDLQGQCLTNLFPDNQMKKRPVIEIPSYGDRNVESNLLPSDADSRMKAELKALGYI